MKHHDKMFLECSWYRYVSKNSALNWVLELNLEKNVFYIYVARNVSKFGVFPGPYFPLLEPHSVRMSFQANIGNSISETSLKFTHTHTRPRARAHTHTHTHAYTLKTLQNGWPFRDIMHYTANIRHTIFVLYD